MDWEEKRIYFTHPNYKRHDPNLRFVLIGEEREPQDGEWFVTKYDCPGHAMLCTSDDPGAYSLGREILRRGKN